jgi:uncharacterized membrane protein YkoI
MALLFATTIFWPHDPRAQGNGNNGNGNGNGNDENGNDGHGNGDANGNEQGGSGQGGNGNSGISNGSGNGGAPGTSNETRATDSVESDEGGELSDDEVLAAVDAGKAVSLETLLPDLRSRTGGEIIEAKLQQVQGSLLYVVTAITPDGKVITEYYYARSGLHVEQ